MKNPSLANNPVRPRLYNGFPWLTERINTENTRTTSAWPRSCGRWSTSMTATVFCFGEVFGSPSVLKSFPGEDDGLQLVFLFDFPHQYDADWFARTITEFDHNFPAPAQPTYVLENHDRSRTIDRVHGDRAKAAVLAVILLTVRGVPTVYMGQEIGMSNTPLRFRTLDPVASTVFRRVPQAVADRMPERLNRDEMRTPMQWGRQRMRVSPGRRSALAAGESGLPPGQRCGAERRSRLDAAPLPQVVQPAPGATIAAHRVIGPLPARGAGHRRNDIIVLANLWAGAGHGAIHRRGSQVDTGQVAVGAGRRPCSRTRRSCCRRWSPGRGDFPPGARTGHWTHPGFLNRHLERIAPERDVCTVSRFLKVGHDRRPVPTLRGLAGVRTKVHRPGHPT